MPNENTKPEHIYFTVWDQDICMFKGVEYESYDKESDEITMDLGMLQAILKDFAKKVSDEAIKAYKDKHIKKEG